MTPAQDFTLPMHYVRQIADQVRSLGGDVAAWLSRSQLTEADLQDTGRALSFLVVYQLVRDALDLTGSPRWGCWWGTAGGQHPRHAGLCRHEQWHLAAGLDLFERYIGLRTSLVSVSHQVEGEVVRVRFEEPLPLGDIRRSVLEAIMLTVKTCSMPSPWVRAT